MFLMQKNLYNYLGKLIPRKFNWMPLMQLCMEKSLYGFIITVFYAKSIDFDKYKPC